MTHPHGTFCFAELQAHDVEAARRFYESVLGWTTADAPAENGRYWLFKRDGQDVAALRRGNGPSRWLPYLCVTSVEETAARAQELRAAIVSAPADLADLARVSVISDPAGGTLGLWQARTHAGAAVLDQPGSMWWAELLTRDVNGAKTFYSNLLGWKPVDTLKYGIRYTVFKSGDDSVGGVLPIAADWGALAPRWQVLFAIENCDAGVERVKAAGGSLVYGPNDIPNAGRGAVVADTGGATFVLMQPLVS